MGLFDAFSSRDSSVKTNTTVTQDSYNVSRSETSVYDNLGNVNVTLGGEPMAWDKILPVLVVAAVGVGVLAMLRRR